jgi:uncharacterized protein YeaO (DUF488 family)
MIRIKRVYDPAELSDGQRFLVDRLWPRGIRKSALKFDGWIRDAAPSTELRQWFHHDPSRWNEFRLRYFAELESKPEVLEPLAELQRNGTVTLLSSAKDTNHNHAIALMEFLKAHRIATGPHGRSNT